MEIDIIIYYDDKVFIEIIIFYLIKKKWFRSMAIKHASKIPEFFEAKKVFHFKSNNLSFHFSLRFCIGFHVP